MSLVMSMSASHASSQLDVTVLIPSKPGGSIQTSMNAMIPAAAAQGINLIPKYLGTCEKVIDVLSNSTKSSEPIVYAWANDYACRVPSVPTTSNHIGTLAQASNYLCGKKDSLSKYQSSDNLKLAVNVGSTNIENGENIKKGLGNSTMRIVSYANTGAIKTALITGEVDLVYTTIGPALAAEGAATCYAVSSSSPEPKMITIRDITKNMPGSVFSIYIYLGSFNLSQADFVKVQNVIQTQIKSVEYKDLVLHKMFRQLPADSVAGQVNDLTQ